MTIAGRYVPEDFAKRVTRDDHGCPWCGWWGGVNRGQPHEYIECLACGVPQCRSHPECRACLVGWLPGWSRNWGGQDALCGYKGCDNDAVAKAPRVGRVCATHLARPKVNGETLADVVERHRTEALTNVGGYSTRWRRMVWRAVVGFEDQSPPELAPIPGAVSVEVTP